jgi:nitrite reductase (NADH) small subunit
VTCPWHAWRFCIDDGLWLDNPKSNIRVPCYDVRVVGDDIQVNVPVEEPTEPATDEPPTDEPAGPPATDS